MYNSNDIQQFKEIIAEKEKEIKYNEFLIGFLVVSIVILIVLTSILVNLL